MEPHASYDVFLTHFITALTGLIVAIATLIATIRNQRSTQALHVRLNGPLDKLASHVERLSAQYQEEQNKEKEYQAGKCKDVGKDATKR